MSTALVLASGSPRRRQLLESLGLEFSVVPADVDESVRDGEVPVEYVARVARDKALAVVNRMGAGAAVPGTVVLAADTTVDVDGEIFGKPIGEEDARRMLRSMAGRTHQVHSAVVGWRISGIEAVTVTTDVMFAELSDAAIDWYLATGEHADKAGAYGMQGVGGSFVRRIDGSPSNVIGLPLAETIGVLRACGRSVAGA